MHIDIGGTWKSAQGKYKPDTTQEVAVQHTATPAQETMEQGGLIPQQGWW